MTAEDSAIRDIHVGEHDMLSVFRPDTLIGALVYLLVFIVLAMLILIFGGLAAVKTPADIFPDIKVPAIVIVGADDTPFLAASDYMAAKIPGAKKAVIEGAGHSANIDQPERFNAALLGFLKEAGLMA